MNKIEMMKRIWVNVQRRLPPSNAGDIFLWLPAPYGVRGTITTRSAYHARLDAERFIKEGFFEWVRKHKESSGFYAKYHWAHDKIFTHWTEAYPPISWEEFIKGDY
jgi:hypothetical protein